MFRDGTIWSYYYHNDVIKVIEYKLAEKYTLYVFLITSTNARTLAPPAAPMVAFGELDDKLLRVC